MKKLIPILVAGLAVLIFAKDTSAYSQHILFRDSANSNTIVDGQTLYDNYYGTYSSNYSFYNEHVKSVYGLQNEPYDCESYERSGGIYATRICVADGITFTTTDLFGGDEQLSNPNFVLPKGDYTIEVSQTSQFVDWTTNNNDKYFFNILKGKNLANTEDLHSIESAGIISNGDYSLFEKITLQNYYCAGSNCFFRFLFRVNEDKTITLGSDILSLTMNLTSFQESNNIYYLYNSFVSAVPFGNSVYNNTVVNNPLVELASYDYGSVPDTEPTNPDMTLDDINNSIKDINNNINNSDVSGAGDTAGGFFNDFKTDTHGLTAIITAPLNTIKSLLNTSCEVLVLPLPFVSKTIELPCMATVYGQFQPFYSLYQVITYGFIAYWVCVRIFNLVKDFKNPEHDEVEVMDL